MYKALGVALIVIGGLMLVFGFQASDSLASDVSRAFTGTPTDKSVWLLAGGAASAALGTVLTLRRA